MKNRNIVKQDYKLVNAKYKLNTSEIKFIMTAIAQIDKDDKELQEYEIKVSELENKLQVEQNETRLKQFAKKLLSKPLEVPTQDGWIVANWFADIEYIRGQARFKVTISEKLKPYLLDLKQRFIKYNLNYILPLTSSYSIRLYQLFKEYEKLTKRTFTVEELQDLLQVPKSLKRYDNFKRKVLKVAEKELIENCDIFFEFKEIKKGKKVNEILFRIKPNRLKTQETRDENLLFDKEDLKSEYEDFIGNEVATVDGKCIITSIEKYHDYLKVNLTNLDKNEVTYFKTKDTNELKKILKKTK